MAYEFKLPDLGEGLTEGEIARWLVAEGQEVAEDDPLVEIQTDKTTVEIPSPAAGTVARILVAEGEVAPVGAVLVVIGETGEARRGQMPQAPVPRRAPAASSPRRRSRVQATPLVRRIAQELGVDLAAVTAARAPGGRVTEEDVRGGRGRTGRRDGGCRCAASGGAIVEHLTTAHREIPAVTFVEECDFTGVDLGAARAAALTARRARALKEFPELNARLEGDEIVYLDRYDLGVAVQTDDGLVVPVVRGCDTALARRARRRGRAARRRPPAQARSTPEELRGSTFTVTSAGKLGGLFVTPLINHPEVGDPRRPPDRRARRSSATARSSCAGSGTSRSRSTTASSTAPARPPSAST